MATSVSTQDIHDNLTTEKQQGETVSGHTDHSDDHKKHKLNHLFHFHKNHKHKDKECKPGECDCHIKGSKDDLRSSPSHEDNDKEHKQDHNEQETDKENKDKEEKLHSHGIGFRPMSSCFDFRNRTVSFDLHNIGQSAKMSLLSKLLNRSKSESSMKVPPKNNKNDKEKENTGLPASHSPKPSPGAPPRRRFVRVVRDDQCLGEEYINPHVTRRFSKNHWEKHHLRKATSLDDSDVDSRRPLPYTVTGHTILKKSGSVDAEGLITDTHKHAKFNEQVEVLEYDIKDKILSIRSDSNVLHAKLHDGEFIHDEVILSRDACDAISVGLIEVELPHPNSITLEAIRETVSPTDLSPDSDITETTVITEAATDLSDSDNDADDLVSDSVEVANDEVFAECSTEPEHVPKASRQISAEEECSVKKTKLENGLDKMIEDSISAVES